MKIIWTDRALQRVLEISEYIALDNTSAAERWVETVFEQTEKVAEFPMIGRMFPAKREPNIRELIHGNYRIVYEIFDDRIEVLTVRNFKESKVL